MSLREWLSGVEELIEWGNRALDWFENEDEISVNSSAYKELVEIMKKIKQNEKGG